ncbi:MAG: rubrerythrin family protein [Methanosphaera stadtmanae]|jgi:rubrerythrin|nr:rubrerythrin family protein [Methanosphaera stadtmanae]
MVKTLENLAKAFVGESQARNRYTMYSKIAKKEGYEKIAEIFEITAGNEHQHAKVLFKMIQELKENEEPIQIDTDVCTTYGTTAENLKSSAEGENDEATSMYPEFADVAEEEGFPVIAARLRNIGKVEAHHEARYRQLLAMVEGETFFKRDTEVTWVCRKCGFVYVGQEPPAKCPICEHPASYFEVETDIF